MDISLSSETTEYWTRAKASLAANAGRQASDGRLVRRIAILAALAALEAVAFRAWLPGLSTAQAGTVGALLTERGPGTLRFVVVQFAVVVGMVSLLFGESQISGVRSRLVELAERSIDRRALVAHAVAALVFVGLTTVLLGLRVNSPAGIAVGVLWLASAAATGALLALAFLPTAFWTLVGRAATPVLTFAFVTAIGGYGFGRLAELLWQPLSHATMNVAYAVLHPIVPDLAMDLATFTIGNTAFQVQIQAGCSGYEGLGLMLVFTSAWLWFHRADWRFPHALAIVPIGLASVWILNCARVAGLILIGIDGSPDVALGGFHTQAGWVAFNAVALGTCVAARHVPWFLRGAAQDRSREAGWSNPTAAYLLPCLAIMAGAMAAQLASSGFEWLYVIRVVLCAAALCYFFPRYRALSLRVSWCAVFVGGLVFALWVGLDAEAGARGSSPMPAALAAAPALERVAWIIVRAFGAVVTVPVAEELAFRGFLLRRFDSEDFESVDVTSVSWIAIVLSSIAFGVLHGDRWIAGTIAGAFYAIVYLRRGSIGDAIAAHATTNALLVAEVLLLGKWQFW